MTARTWVAPAVTTLLLAAAWTEPHWSERPAPEGVTITAGPQLVAPGDSPAPARQAGFEIDVQVDGARQGHPVELEMWSDGGWRPEDSGGTDDRGHVHLVASHGAYGRVITNVDGSRVTQPFDATTAGPVTVAGDDFDADLLGPAWMAVPQPADWSYCTVMGLLGRTVMADQLALTVLEDPTQICQDRPLVVNGHVALQVPIAYGTVAARIRFPRSRSVSAQFWLQPGNPAQPWVMDREHEGVVIAETRGTTRDPGVGTSVNRLDGTRVVASRELIPGGSPTDGDFHVYAVTWTPTGFTFSVDGELVRRAAATAPAAPLFIGLSVLPIAPRPVEDPDERTMYVDWVRAWAP